jgi:hypothetical protein
MPGQPEHRGRMVTIDERVRKHGRRWSVAKHRAPARVVSLFGSVPFLRPGPQVHCAPCGAAVKTGRRPPPEAARSGLCAGHAQGQQVTEFSATISIGQPALEAALEKLDEEILGTIVEGAFCAVQDWDHRIDCCIRLGDGRTVGEMVPLSTLDGQVLRAVGERLRRRKQDEGFEFRNELRPPILISRSP